MRIACLALACLLSAPLPASAVTCRTGIPCGNSCISVQDTCHIGAGSAGRESGEPDWEAIGVLGGISAAALLGLIIWYFVPPKGFGLDVQAGPDGAGVTVAIPL